MEFIGIPMTEEMKAHLERQDMAIESYRHDVQRLFDELPKEHLLTLRIMLNQFTTEADSRLTSYYEGVAATTLAYRFKVCGGCGRDHSEELLDEPAPEDKNFQTEKFFSLREGDKTLFNVPTDEGGLSELTVEQFRQMEEYNLDDVRDENTLKLLGFICKNCGLRYVSIEDRMLKRPDDCHGCQIKSAHG